MRKSAALFGDKLTNANVVEDVVDFMLGRFRAWYQDEGIAVDVIQAVLARRPTKPADFDVRVRAVSHFRTLDSAEALAAANKRVSNILAKVEGEISTEIDRSLLVEAEEKLWQNKYLRYKQNLHRNSKMANTKLRLIV
ncbi:glycyl-tRNA synthetase subunit beta [Actinobacillus equuli]|nr:glycyl-tRNA synthetase subunit beta [Actinobacillus equuli]